MRKFFTFVLLAVFIIAISGISTKLQENVAKDFKTKLERSIKDKKLFQEIKSNYYYYATVKFSKTLNTADLKVCDLLDNKDVVKTLNSEQAFYYYNFAVAAECTKIQLSPEKIKSVQDAVNSDELHEFYKEVVVGFLYKSYSNNQTKVICEKVQDFLEASGAAKATKKKTSESSYEDTHKVLNVVLSCFESGVENNLAGLLKKAIGNIALNSLQINKDTRAIFDGKCPVSTTAQILYYVRKLSKYVDVEDFVSSYPEYLNYLSEAALGLSCAKGVFSLFRALDSFLDFPLVAVDNKPVISGKNSLFTIKVNNVYGADLTTVPKIQGQLSLNGKKLPGTINFIKKEKVFQGNLDTNFLTELRLYEIILTVSDGSLSYNVNKLVGISTKASVQNLKFEVVQSKVAPKILSNEVTFHQIFKEQVTANQNSFIHIQFELKFSDTKAVPIKQIAVRLKHPEYSVATNLVNAVYDGNTNLYKAVVDVGDPDHVMAYNGLYQAELIIADELLLENIRWTFATFNISFQKSAKNAPLSDIDYTPLPLISHRFPSPRNPPPSFITVTFCLVIVGVVIVFFGLLKGIDVNFKRFPSDFRGGFFSLLFTLVILSYIGLLCLFWVKINLIETLTILVVMFIPTILIGNESLVSLKLEQEVGKVKEIKE